MRRPPLALAVCVVLAVGSGILIRLGAAATAMIWFDEATVGLMGRQTLRGEFVFFFHGQTYMGAVDAYLDALPFALLGSSVGTLRLWPLAASLLHVALCGLLARRLAGVGFWAILLALRVVDAGAMPAQRTRALLAGGLVAGLGWWMNLLMSIPLMADRPPASLPTRRDHRDCLSHRAPLGARDRGRPRPRGLELRPGGGRRLPRAHPLRKAGASRECPATAGLEAQREPWQRGYRRPSRRPPRHAMGDAGATEAR